MNDRVHGRENKLLHRAALVLAASALTSALAALLRDRLLASAFGASRELDIYFAAFRIPDVLYALGLFLVSSTAVLPLLALRRATAEAHEHAFVSELLSALAALFVVGGAVGYVAMPYMVPMLFQGFSGDEVAHIVQLSRLLLLSPVLLGISTLLSSVVQSRGFFASTALAPLLYNAGIIFGILVLAPYWGMKGIVWGVLFGALLHFAAQLPAFLRAGFTFRFGRVRMGDVITVVHKSYPRSAAITMQGGIAIMMTSLASLIGAGAIAVYQLSFNLAMVPLAVIGLSYGTAVFPLLSRLAAEKQYNEYLRVVSQVVKQVMLWSMLATAVLVVFRAHIVRVVLGAGAFGWVDTQLAAASLACFALGLVAQSQLQIFTRACYALDDVRGPFVGTLIGGVVAVVSAYILQYVFVSNAYALHFFEQVFRLEGVRMARILSLPLGYSIGMTTGVLFVMLRLRARLRHIGRLKLTRSTMEHLAGALTLVAVSVFVLRLTAPYFPLETLMQVMGHAVIALVAGVGVACGVLVALDNSEIIDMLRAMQGRLTKRVNPPEAEHL